MTYISSVLCTTSVYTLQSLWLQPFWSCTFRLFNVLILLLTLTMHHATSLGRYLTYFISIKKEKKTRLKRLSVHDREIRYILGLFETFGTVWDFLRLFDAFGTFWNFLGLLGLFETFWTFWDFLGFLRLLRTLKATVMWH